MKSEQPPADQPVEDRQLRPFARASLRVLLVVGVAVLVTFWTWALFFASKEAVNKIEDLAWAANAQQICEQATIVRESLADFREIVDADAAMIRERADIVDATTAVLEAMLDDVVAVQPNDPKGIAIVPDWEDEYRIYLGDRYRYAEQLRSTGQNLPFYETAFGLPISERLETFAADNEMSACAPPRDLTR